MVGWRFWESEFCFSSVYSEETELLMKKGEKVEVAGFEILLEEIIEDKESNYFYRRGVFAIECE